MKKTLFMVSVLLLCACQQTDKNIETNSMKQHRLIPLESSEKTGGLFQMSTFVGHSSSQCNGCVLLGNEWIHVPCVGFGNICTADAILNIEPVEGSNTYTATTLDTTALTDGDLFLMPDRSLLVTASLFGKSTWLNIPEQLVFRDPNTQQFTFTGLFYTDYQYYNNN